MLSPVRADMLDATHRERRLHRAEVVKANADQIVEALALGEPRTSIASRLGIRASDVIPLERKARKVAAASRTAAPPSESDSAPRPSSRRRNAARARRERRKQAAKAKREESRLTQLLTIAEEIRSTDDSYATIGKRFGVSTHVVNTAAREFGVCRTAKRKRDLAELDHAILAAVEELQRAEIPVKAGLVASMLEQDYRMVYGRLRALGIIAAPKPCESCGDPACSSELCGALTPADANKIHLWSVFSACHHRPSRRVGPSPLTQAIARGEDGFGQT